MFVAGRIREVLGLDPDAVRAVPARIIELLDHATANFPQRVCIDFLGREWTYADVFTEVDRVAASLQAAGLEKGDRFGLCLPNSPYSIILYFAVLRAGGTVVNLKAETENHPDLVDRASSESDRALELRTRDRQRKLISKIDEALRRIDDGSYGYCEETGEPISLGRLEARPTATLSVEAQERHERRERVHRDD